MSAPTRAVRGRDLARGLSGALALVVALGGTAAAEGASSGVSPTAADGLSTPMVRFAQLRALLLGELQDICPEGETTIYFEEGLVEPQQIEAARARRVGDCLAGLPIGRAVEVVGFADPAGLAAANRTLAARRARHVADLLVERGVERGRLVVRALGEARTGPVTLRTHSRRRVEIRFVPLARGAGYGLAPTRLQSPAPTGG